METENKINIKKNIEQKKDKLFDEILDLLADKIVDKLNEREIQKEPRVPWYPSPFPCEPIDNNYLKCPSCGLDFSGTMGYVCPSENCPVQLKVTF